MVFAGFLIIIGFVLLIYGANFLIDGSSAIAKRLKITELVIGLTLVAFGTSAPELFVNILASVKKEADIAIGNILGSNIANIFLILGISSIIYPLTLRKSTIRKEIPLSMLAAIVFVLLANGGSSFLGLTRADGLILIVFFLFFIYYAFTISKDKNETFGVTIHAHSLARSLILIILGLVGLLIGGNLVVQNTVLVASTLGISEAVIALTIIAVGTSLPELVTSVVAAYKKRPDIAVGNIVGSNIFNIFWVLGISSIINPLPFSRVLFFDAGVVVLATLLLFVAMFIGKKHLLERWQGIIFVLLYIAYIISLVLR